MNAREYWDRREAQWQHGPRAKRDIDYYWRAPLDQLEEWNEGEVFEARNITIAQGDLGVMVTMEFRGATVIFTEDEEEVGHLAPSPYWDQLCAVFGDDDMLCRLVIFGDDPKHEHPRFPGLMTQFRGTQEYINHALRR